MTDLGTRLFVGNLPEEINENELRSVFSSYGEITNFDLKSKPATSDEKKKFAFITLSASNYNIESCIKHFSNEDFKGKRLYVTRARESFLERLQRERELAQKKDIEKPANKESPKKHPTIKLGDKLNPRKRKLDPTITAEPRHGKHTETKEFENKTAHITHELGNGEDHTKTHTVSKEDKKKTDSDKKRIESMKKKRQEFKEKQMIIKTGLTGVDKVQNKKIIFSDNVDEVKHVNGNPSTGRTKKDKKSTLFEDDESDREVNFDIKKQYEGKKGQKILDLQSRYKSDKRFILDERFMDNEQSDKSDNEAKEEEDFEEVDLEQADEKTTQLNILQDVLGVTIRSNTREPDSKKMKFKPGMLRFDPSHPEHAKFLAPVDNTKQDQQKKSKKKNKDKQVDAAVEQTELNVQKVEVSKEQFYKVSETLKESLAQPTSFSLRSLFGKNEEETNDIQEQDTNYIPLGKPKASKVRNPLDPGEKNPFEYDSSESEDEDVPAETNPEATPVVPECKAVWKENLFFTMSDQRFKEGLAFFNKPKEAEAHKERRELKSLMKKRIFNTERKNQMFKKKIGGRKKSMKKSYRKKS